MQPIKSVNKLYQADEGEVYIDQEINRVNDKIRLVSEEIIVNYGNDSFTKYMSSLKTMMKLNHELYMLNKMKGICHDLRDLNKFVTTSTFKPTESENNISAK